MYLIRDIKKIPIVILLLVYSNYYCAYRYKIWVLLIIQSSINCFLLLFIRSANHCVPFLIVTQNCKTIRSCIFHVLSFFFLFPVSFFFYLSMSLSFLSSFVLFAYPSLCLSFSLLSSPYFYLFIFLSHRVFFYFIVNQTT